MEETIDDNSTGIQVTEQMKNDLRSASPWMKFVGIFYMVVSGLGALGILLLMTQVFHISLLIAAGLYGLMIYLGTLVLKMGTEYNNFVDHSSTASLEKAFSAQKKFWMIMGILILLSILMMIIGYGYIQELQDGANFN